MKVRLWLIVCINICVSSAGARACYDIFQTDLGFRDLLPTREMNPNELGALAKEIGQSRRYDVLSAVSALPLRAGKLTSVKLAEGENGSIWAHIWNGVPTDIHDHIEFQAGMYVLRGTLYEDVFIPPSPIHATRVYHEGEVFVQGGEKYVHRVRGDNAVSLHVYGPSPVFIVYEYNPSKDRLQLAP